MSKEVVQNKENIDCVSLSRGSFNRVGSRSVYDGEFKALEVEGAKELATLCPVSKLTGFPSSYESILNMITDSNARIVDALFQPLQEVMTTDGVSDDDKLRLLKSRLDTGSFFENDRAVEILGDIVKEFMPDASKEVVNEVVSQQSQAQQEVNQIVDNV